MIECAALSRGIFTTGHNSKYRFKDGNKIGFFKGVKIAMEHNHEILQNNRLFSLHTIFGLDPSALLMTYTTKRC